MDAREQTGGRYRRAYGPAFLAGFGLGGFLDGIVLHQVLRWHHLLSGYRAADTRDRLAAHVFYDGVFHLVTWAVVAAAVLWLAARSRDVAVLGTRRFLGVALVGFGGFQVVDHLVFHLALGAHHIRMVDNFALYDWSFFSVGLLLIAAGAVLARRAGGRAVT